VSFGPIEVLVLRFPGNQFKGEIVPALAELVDSGTIRIIDAIVAKKDADGSITVVEIDQLGPDEASLGGVVDDSTEWLTEEDAERLTANIPPNSAAAIMLFENTWATRFVEAVANANGEVVLNERIPRAVVEELIAAASA
jgi:Family of unknown function (DUF6325)